MKRHGGALLSSIRIDKSSDRRISVQLYMALRELLLSGGFKPGDRMPATRTLALEIGVSRTTVIDAIDRLVSEGLLKSRVGAGTYVSEALAAQIGLSDATQGSEGKIAKPRLSRTTERAASSFAPRSWLPHHSTPFITALPALDAFPMAQWARLSARHWRKERDHIGGYGEPFGYGRLRSAIAQQLNAARGIKCDPEQIFVVNGAQHAFSTIGLMLVNPGEAIWFENPGALGARNAFLACDARLVPVDIDAEGFCVEDALAKERDFRLAFVTPSHQQPLGSVMSLARRLALLQAAKDADAMDALEQARALLAEQRTQANPNFASVREAYSRVITIEPEGVAAMLAKQGIETVEALEAAASIREELEGEKKRREEELLKRQEEIWETSRKKDPLLGKFAGRGVLERRIVPGSEARFWLRWRGADAYELVCKSGRYDLNLFAGYEIGVEGVVGEAPVGGAPAVMDVAKLQVLSRR